MERRLRSPLAAVLASAIAVAAGCGSDDDAAVEAEARSEARRVTADPAYAGQGAAVVNGFGADLYRVLATDDDGNIVFSPSSVAFALAMARGGANGVTAAEIDAAFHASGEGVNVASALNGLDAALAARPGTYEDREGGEGELAIASANAIWAQEGYEIEAAYLDLLAEQYGAGLNLMDPAGDPEAARQAVNEWVAAHTADRIPELLAPNAIDELTRLVLVNAIVLTAPWYHAFSPSATGDAPFTTSAGTEVTAPFMHSQSDLEYASGPDWQAVRLPYIGGELAFEVILPDEGSLGAFEAALSADRLAEIDAGFAEHKVILALPKFRAEIAFQLEDALKEVGITTAFDADAADFSGITAEEPLFISAVVHKAFLEIDEEGTEAAAATAVMMEGGSAPSEPVEPVEFVADRPFLFAVRDLQTGAVLFLGRIADPTA